MPAAAVVWTVWAALFAGSLLFVAAFGRDCPFMDEWAFLPALAGDTDPVRWAWQPHAEHRWLLPRLLFVELFRLTGSLRPCMFLNVAGCAAAAAVLARAARQSRGRTSLADVFFPLAFLHPGHWENWLWSSQLCMVLAVLLAALLTAETVKARPSRRVGGVAGVSVALLPLCGAPGLAFGAGGAAWLAAVAAVAARERDWPRAAGLGLAVAAAGVISAVTVATAPASPFAGLPRTLPNLAGLAARLAGVAFGTAGVWLWPAAAVAFAVLGVGAVRGLVRLARTGDPLAAVGLAAMLGASLLLAGGITWGRGWGGPAAAFSSRYVVLMATGAAVLFLTCVRAGSPALAARGPAALAVLAAVAWPLNLLDGLDRGAWLAGRMDALAADLRDGLPPDLIADRYHWQLFLKPDDPAADLDLAERCGFGVFRGRGPVMRVETRAVPVDAREVGPAVVLTLPPDPDAVAVRLTGGFVRPADRVADFRVRWADADGDHEERVRVPMNVEHPVVVRVRGAVAAVEVVPDRPPAGYRVTGVEIVTR